MIPILYESITEGSVPSTYGLGPLTDTIAAEVTEERNGGYELRLEYAADGIHAGDIAPNRFIKAKPNFTDDPQLFRIYKVGKTINGKFEVNAQHISYDLSGKIITTGTAANCAAACALLEAAAGNFQITTDKSTSANFKITAPASVRSWFGGREGSLLDVYGGEWKYDNYTASLKTARGSNRGVTIRYGKNLTELSQELDMSNLATGVVPYYVDQNGNVTTGTKVLTGLALDVPRDLAVDFSEKVKPESSTPITTQLTNLANKYISSNNFKTITNSITLDFVQTGETLDRVDLCDTVNIYFEALGLTASAKCVELVWDVLKERYSSVTFGESRTSIADTIAVNQLEIEESASRDAVARATQLITGNLGGYVILHDSNGDGAPDELLIMDTEDITTCTKCWRWNKNGLGHSSTGYSGPFGLAMTANGEIVADYVSTGVLNASLIQTGVLDANLIKAGVISDVAGNSTIDMTNGVATLKNLIALDTFTHKDANNVKRTEIFHNNTQGTTLEFYKQNGDKQVSISANPTYGGTLYFYNLSNVRTVELYTGVDGGQLGLHTATTPAEVAVYPDPNQKWYNLNLKRNNGSLTVALTADDDGGIFQIYNTSGNAIIEAESDTNRNGLIYVNNAAGTDKIDLYGSNGHIWCTQVDQGSSRKIKKNIEPIEDARKILDLDAVAFDYKEEEMGTDKRGFIAEDVAEILPNLVIPETDKKPAGLDYIGMIPYLQAVIKEQDARIKALEDKLNGRA